MTMHRNTGTSRASRLPRQATDQSTRIPFFFYSESMLEERTVKFSVFCRNSDSGVAFATERSERTTKFHFVNQKYSIPTENKRNITSGAGLR